MQECVYCIWFVSMSIFSHERQCFDTKLTAKNKVHPVYSLVVMYTHWVPEGT